MLKNWPVCWKTMTFKDLYGYPLWETQLHDVLQAFVCRAAVHLPPLLRRVDRRLGDHQ